VIATDFDRTLVWEDGTLRPRSLQALHDARDAGLHVIVVTGRMVQSVRRFLEPAELHEPVICYQGAVVADADGKWLRHEPIPLELAKETLAALKDEGYDPNVYIDDELYVSDLTQAARDYADFQHLTIHEVGDTLEWLSAPPTKLVAVGDPQALDGVEARMKTSFAERLYISKSLPFFLEFAQAGVTKGAGLDFLSQHMGFTKARTVAFGDGENDVELVEWPAYGVAVANAHDRVKAVASWICPPASEEGVAQVIEALLDSKR
jgi:Cof subfamily protein (haloacid dehalogenase superfamily)